MTSESQSTRILVVDDNPVVLLNVCHLLRSAGYDVLEAASGHECLEVVRAQNPDLVLLDVVLADTDGIDLCRQIKGQPETARSFVVLLSSTATSSDRQVTGLEAGADGYIARPIENRELLARVQALLRIQKAEAALRNAHDELEQRVRDRTTALTRANESLNEQIRIRQEAEQNQRRAAERLRALSLRLVDVQEAERRFLSRELHDEIGQMLTGLKLSLEIAGRVAPKTVAGQLEEPLAILSDLMERVRQLSLDLRPQVLDDLGLLRALEWHFSRYTKQTSIRVRFKHSQLREGLPQQLEIAIFRIVQEALTNVARHAQVQEATVRLWVDAKRLGVQIHDQGSGFDAAKALEAYRSSGLCGMRERAELLGGEFSLESAPGSGTTLTVELPLATAFDGPTGPQVAHDHDRSG